MTAAQVNIGTTTAAFGSAPSIKSPATFAVISIVAPVAVILILTALAILFFIHRRHRRRMRHPYRVGLGYVDPDPLPPGFWSPPMSSQRSFTENINPSANTSSSSN